MEIHNLIGSAPANHMYASRSENLIENNSIKKNDASMVDNWKAITRPLKL